MNFDQLPSLLTSTASLVGVIILFIKLFWPGQSTKKESSEANKADADAAEAWEGIAARSAARIKDLEANSEKQSLQIATLSKEMAVLRETIAERDLQIIRYQSTLSKWRAGIDILINQLKEKNETPKWQPNGE